MSKSAKRKYPPYPGSSMDYAVRESARMALRKPNRVICVYCHGQALSEATLVNFHQPDCPAHLAEVKVTNNTIHSTDNTASLPIMVEYGQRRRGEALAQVAFESKSFKAISRRLADVAIDCADGELTADEWDAWAVVLAEMLACFMKLADLIRQSDPLAKPKL